MTVADERVAAGATLLDQFGPPHWDDQIDLARLRVASWNDCPLGQVYGSYAEGMYRLDKLRPLGVVSCGFNVWSSTDGITYASLDSAWRDLIAKRRLARGLQVEPIIAQPAEALPA